MAIPVLGSALGSLAGAKLGEFLGGIFGDSPKVVGTVTGGTGGFSGSGVDAATGGASFLNSQLLELESILGTTAITLSDLSIRVKDNGAIWVQIANEASVKFKDMNEALNYAFTELIRSAQLPADVAGQLQTVIANSTTENADELLADLQFVQGLINATQGEITVGFRQVVTEFHQNVQRLNELGLDGSLAFGALSQSLSDMRNQILGINESAADRIRRQAAEFNAELAILKAEQTAKLVDLKLRAEVVQGQGQITKAAIQSDLALHQRQCTASRPRPRLRPAWRSPRRRPSARRSPPLSTCSRLSPKRSPTPISGRLSVGLVAVEALATSATSERISGTSARESARSVRSSGFRQEQARQRAGGP